MQTNDVKTILKQNNIETLEKLQFKTQEETLLFLKNIEKLISQKLNISFIENQLKEIIIKTKINKETISKLKKINFKEYKKIAKQSLTNKRLKRTYNDFLKLIKLELNLEKNKIFEKQKDFDIEKDTKEKAKKFNIEIEFDYKQPGKKNTVNDFILYFNKRLEHFTTLLEPKINTDNLTRISTIQEQKGSNNPITIIGLISEINYTKNGHIILTLEDKSGQTKCFINKNKLQDKQLKNTIENLCLDEGISINGKIGENLIWVDEITTVSAQKNHQTEPTKDNNYIILLGDLHIGSNTFIDENFEKFIDWISGKTKNEKWNQLAKKIKYIIITGDLIEGIGIYPGQGKNAKLISTSLQYKQAAQLLNKIPKDKCIINISGDHDTNRLSEPQQKLPYNKAYPLYNQENIINLSNPSIIKLFQNQIFYLYHGASLTYYANNIKSLREKGGAKAPQEIIKFLLEKQHIAPSHGSTLYIPDSQQDPLKIEQLPNYIATGHTHKIGIAQHKGCNILCTGCWTTISEYQEKMGLYPDTGKCILLNTKTQKSKILNFYKD